MQPKLIKNYEAYFCLGQSNMCHSFSTIDKKQQTKFILKCFQKQDFPLESNILEHLMKEVEFLIKSKDLITKEQWPIIKLVETFFTEKNYYIVIENCEDWMLSSYIQKEHFVDEQKAIDLFYDILRGYQVYKKQNLPRRDITIKNILIHKGKVFLDDFGFKRMIDSTYFQTNPHEIEHSIYDPPESLLNNKANYLKYDQEKNDSWSLGIIFYWIVFGKFPFQYKTGDQKLDFGKLSFQNQKLSYKPSENCVNLLIRMLQEYPDKRINFSDILYHSLFADRIKKINSIKIQNKTFIQDKNLESQWIVTMRTIYGGIDQQQDLQKNQMQEEKQEKRILIKPDQSDIQFKSQISKIKGSRIIEKNVIEDQEIDVIKKQKLEETFNNYINRNKKQQQQQNSNVQQNLNQSQIKSKYPNLINQQDNNLQQPNYQNQQTSKYQAFSQLEQSMQLNNNKNFQEQQQNQKSKYPIFNQSNIQNDVFQQMNNLEQNLNPMPFLERTVSQNYSQFDLTQFQDLDQKQQNDKLEQNIQSLLSSNNQQIKNEKEIEDKIKLLIKKYDILGEATTILEYRYSGQLNSRIIQCFLMMKKLYFYNSKIESALKENNSEFFDINNWDHFQNSISKQLLIQEIEAKNEQLFKSLQQVLKNSINYVKRNFQKLKGDCKTILEHLNLNFECIYMNFQFDGWYYSLIISLALNLRKESDLLEDLKFKALLLDVLMINEIKASEIETVIFSYKEYKEIQLTNDNQKVINYIEDKYQYAQESLQNKVQIADFENF